MREYMLAASLLCLFFTSAWALAAPVTPATSAIPEEGPVKIAFNFKNTDGNCQMALTRDSVGILALDSTAGALEPDDENGFETAVRKRALSAGERDTAGMLMSMTHAFKGSKRYACAKKDGYAFSIWSDSLTLHCDNCFSCSDGISMPEAKMLARFGKLTLWLYRIKGEMQPD
jgi:hypothetical protein